MTVRPDLPIALCDRCRRRLEFAGRLLAALGDGNPRTASDLAIALFGPPARGQAVQPLLLDLERTGAVVRDHRVWAVHHHDRVWTWRKSPAATPDLVRVPSPDPAPVPEPAPEPKLEKGVTPEEHEWHLREKREIAARKAAKAARRG